MDNKTKKYFFITIILILSCLVILIECNNSSIKTSQNTEPIVSSPVGTDSIPLPENCEHVYETWTVSVQPSCTEAGVKVSECKFCKNSTSDTVAALGHTEVIDSAKDATCTATGLTEGSHCSVCNMIFVKQDVVPAKGHTEVTDAYVAPTCTASGLTEGKHCSVCSEIFVAQNDIPALGHNEVTDEYVEPTCVNVGYTQGSHCSVCNQAIIAQNEIPALGHREVIDEAAEPNCTASGVTQGKHCSVCNEILVKQSVIPALGHNEIIDAYAAPTCTTNGLTEGKHCSVCKEVIKAQTVIPANGHTEVIDAYIAPTCVSEGLTQGKHCSVCKRTLVAQVTIGKSDDHDYGLWRLTTAPTDTTCGKETSACIHCGKKEYRDVTWDTVDWSFLGAYNDRYGYSHLGTLKNGSHLQTLYDRIDNCVREFHFDTSLDATNGNEVATINYKDLGIDSQLAGVVLKVYRYDNPLYYWLSGSFGGGIGEITLLTESDYASGSSRDYYNALIFDAIDEYTSLVKGQTSAYKIAKIYRDAIIDAVDYADGETALWAHSILGVFYNGSGVCEAYAKTFQLLLNASGVSNIYVIGQSGYVGHAWNLVRMDDGKWYWCDLTWDDGSSSNNYFCVGNTSSFLSDHTVGMPSIYSKHYLYELPTVATSKYKHY